MNTIARQILAILLPAIIAASASAATITWDGGGGDFSWQNASNWSGNVLPAFNDHVVINAPGNVTVTSSDFVSILTLQCSNHLALSGGFFSVTNGSSVVQGNFTMANAAMLQAIGAVTEFRVVGTANADSGSFQALRGAKISIPRLTNYVRGFFCLAGLWQARHPGSVLDFPGLTNLSGGTCAGMDVEASAGGQVQLTNLNTISDGLVSVLADGTNSLVNMPALRTLLATFRGIELEASRGGTVWVPELKRGDTLAVTLNPNATLPFAQMERLVSITVNATNVTFPALTNFDEGTFNVNSGAVVTLPVLAAYEKGGSCAGAFWTVTGTNSTLNLPSLTTMTGGNCTPVNIRAFAGGTVLLTNLQTVVNGAIVFAADGPGSLVDLRRLPHASGATRTVSFEASNGGVVWMPLFLGGPTVEVTIETGGTLQVAQLQTLVKVTVKGTNVTLPALTAFNSGSFDIQNGATVSAPNLTSYNKGSTCASATWTVNGAGCVLDLPGLLSLTGGTCVELAVNALNGGKILLINLPTLTEGALSFTADGTGSLIDLSALQQCQATARPVEFEIRNGGSISIAQLPGGQTVEVSLAGGGNMAVAQMHTLNSIHVAGRSENFPVLTNFNAGSLSVTNGGTISLPVLTAYLGSPSCIVAQWTAGGSNSVLDLPALTNLSGGGCVPVTIQAVNGGAVLLTNLPAIGEGHMAFLANGTNSLIDLPRLSVCNAVARPVGFEARNGGEVAVPLLPGGPMVQVTLRNHGILPVAQMGRLNGATVTGMDVNFPALTNLDEGSLAVSNGLVTADALHSYLGGTFCGQRSFVVSGTGSQLILTNLGTLTGVNCGHLLLKAFSGGDLVLNAVTNIPSGNVIVVSDGAGSLVDLSSLMGIFNTAGLSSLNATNGGLILFGDQPFVTSGVGVSFPLGNGTIPPVFVTNSATTLLFGNPWHSYWVDRRDTTSSTNPWTFERRVPLTNHFQVIGSLISPDTEYRAFEFVADPYLLDIREVSDHSVELVLYAPTNRTLEVQSQTNVSAVTPWSPLETISMTNTFRILAPIPATLSQRYFRAATL